MSLTQSQIEKKLNNENLDELLELWRTEQGAEKRRDLDLMAAAIRFKCLRMASRNEQRDSSNYRGKPNTYV